MHLRPRRSHDTDRAMAAEVRPAMRGLSHRAAAILAVPAGAWLVLAAPTGRARLAAVVFAIGVAAMFAINATVHWREWDPTADSNSFEEPSVPGHSSVFDATRLVAAVRGLADGAGTASDRTRPPQRVSGAGRGHR